jgi:NAD(P)-dependent dehydrogenase (short-subunit alcohol dehydrogenase family)
MDLNNCIAFVTGGASGLGEATVRNIVAKGGKAAIVDLDDNKGNALAAELAGKTIYVKTDVTDEASVSAALAKTVESLGGLNVVVNCAGVAAAQKVISKKGVMPLEAFTKVVQINLVGTFNVIRLSAEKMSANEPNSEGERGVIVNTASAAAFEGQIGQAAYSASKGGVVGMTLPIARELAAHGIRVVTIAPGLFMTPMAAGLPEAAIKALGEAVPFPSRLGNAPEYAILVQQIVENPYLNGETIRLDGALRMQPK